MFGIRIAFFIIFVTRYSGCEHVALIGSNLISADSNYTAFVLTHKLNSDVTLNVIHDYSSRPYYEFEDNFFGKVTFQPLLNIPLKSTLSFSVNSQENCLQQSVNLINPSKSPIVLIYLDKPICKVEDVIKFKVFVLDRKLTPNYDHAEVKIDIFNADKSTVLYANPTKYIKFGVHEGTVNIPTVNPGIWTIQAQIDDRKVSKTFQVQANTNLVTEVFIEMQDTVAFADRKIYLTLHAKEPFSKVAYVYLEAKFVNSSFKVIDKHVKSKDLKSTETVLLFDFQDDLDIRFPTADMILKFIVHVQTASRQTTTVEKEVRMVHKGRGTIQIVRKKFFKPGFKYPVKARVKTFDGKPDNSFYQLSTKIKLVSKNNITEESVYQTNLKNGETVYNLEPKADTKKIIISMEFAGTNHVEEVSVFPGVEEYMQVSQLTKSPSIGSKVKLHVKSTEEMEKLHLAVFGTNGIVLHEAFSDAIGKDEYEIEMILTDKMKPEARGLVFYTRAIDGALIYDEFSISLGFSIDNSLEITAGPSAEPNTNANIQVKTEKDSLVYLFAIDSKSSLISQDNEISRASIYEEISRYLNEKHQQSSNYHFEKTNAFILEPLKNGRECHQPMLAEQLYEPPQPNKVSVSLQYYFPKVLSEIRYTASTSEVQNIQLPIPDMTATWRIFGISVHPEKGFTIAKTQPEISVNETIKHNVQLEFSGVVSMAQDEMHMISIVIRNLNPIRELIGSVVITVQDGYLHSNSVLYEGNQKCVGKNTASALRFDVNFALQQYNLNGDFYVTAKSLNSIILTATFEGDTSSEISKRIDVKNSKELKKSLIKTELVEYARYDLTGIPQNADSVATFVKIHGNLLGPALDGLEEIYGQSMHLYEEIILKYATDAIVCKYFDFIRNPRHPKAIEARKRIVANGPKVVDILNYTPNREKQLGKLAFITGALIDAFKYFEAPMTISETFKYIISQQYYYHPRNFAFRHRTGKFDYYPEFDNHIDISPAARKYIQTASIVITLSKGPNYRHIYSNQIGYSLDYLNRRSNEKPAEFNGDLLNSMTAYAYALNGNQQNAVVFLHKLYHSYQIQTGYEKYFSMYVQTLSYIILTKILVNQDPQEQVQWLLKYRNAQGAFITPYDTVLALQALFEYIKYRNYAKRQFILQYNGNNYNYDPSEFIKVRLFPNTIIKIFDQYLGYMNLYQEYFEALIPRNTMSTATTFVKMGQFENSLEIIVEYAFISNDVELGNSVISLEVELPIGYNHYNPEQEVIGYKIDRRTVIFNYSKLTRNKNYWTKITVVKDLSVKSYYKPLTIKIYDYYRPNIKDTYTYDVKCITN